MAAAVAQDRWFDVRVRGPVAGPDSFGAARALTPVHAHLEPVVGALVSGEGA